MSGTPVSMRDVVRLSLLAGPGTALLVNGVLILLFDLYEVPTWVGWSSVMVGLAVLAAYVLLSRRTASSGQAEDSGV